MIIALPLITLLLPKTSKKPIDLMLPPSRYRAFLQQHQINHQKSCITRQIQRSSVDLEIPELEEDSDEDQFPDLDTFITHHNTHQESKQIRQEYFTTLQNLSDDEYYTEIDRTEFQYHTPVSPYNWPTCRQEVPRPPQVGTPR